MKKLKVLVMAQLNRDILEIKLPNVLFHYAGYAETYCVLEPNDISAIIGEYDILISEFETINRSVIDNAPRLKMIICCRGGISTVVDVEYALKKGISVKNTPGRNADAVAEYVIGQIINCDRFLDKSNYLVQSEMLQRQQFNKPLNYKDSLWGMDLSSPYHLLRGRGLSNITIGIIGYGCVGKVVSKKCKSLGMKVIVYDHSKTDVADGVSWKELDELLAYSDIISVHCSNKSHITMFDKGLFNKMKKGCIFINTARGDLVDEDALIECVKNGHIAKAILDVTLEEPLPLNHKLVGIENIVVTPHIAGATDQVIDVATYRTVDYIKEYIGGI